MVLHELDANLNPQKGVSSRRRDSTRSARSLTSRKGGNVATPPRLLSAKTTPPLGRLLAATHSSTAKASRSTPHVRKPLPSPALTPPLSRLPRKDPVIPTDSDKADRCSARAAPPMPPEGREAQAAKSSEKPATPRILFADKPLPSRPVASLVSTASLSNTGRSLIDASERPLQLTLGGDSYDWPVLTPRSVSAPEYTPGKVVNEVKPISSSTPRHSLSVTALATCSGNSTGVPNLRSVRSSKVSAVTTRSSDPSFVSAEESAASVVHEDLEQPGPSASSATETMFHEQSLRPRTSNTGVTSSVSHLRGMIASTSSNVTSDTPAASSRLHSPSPASFSRPRPESGTHISRLPSTSIPSSMPPETNTQNQKMASRIPVPDSKKATLVNIGGQNERSPSFGTRRLVSPGALAILDQGTKRRLQRVNTGASTASTTSTRIVELEDRAAATRSKTSLSDTASSADEDEISTPVSQPYSSNLALHAKIHQPLTETAGPLIGPPHLLDIPQLRRAPPSKSLHTGPLQTIHSEATLPCRSDADQTKISATTEKSTNLSKIAKRVADIRNAHPNDFGGQNRTNSGIPKATQKMVGEIAQKAKDEDEVGQQNSTFDIVDNETKIHQTHTLSLLEGQGSPPSRDVDNDKLRQMFGRFVRGFDTAASESNTLVGNATAAQKFLERNSASGEAGGDTTDAHAKHMPGEGSMELTSPSLSHAPAASKWSASTPSAPGNSSDIPRKELHRSIGYPFASQIPNTLASMQSVHKTIRHSGPTTSDDSPTLGIGKRAQDKALGSVRRARETIPERGNSTRITAAAASKKAAKIPTTATKDLRRAEDAQRGRDSLPEMPGVKSVPANDAHNTPRSRSKSRTVLDKINGFFSHKRERKLQHSPPPPVPFLHQNKVSNSSNAPVEPDGVDMPSHRAINSPPLTNLSVISHSPPPDQRSASRATQASISSFAGDILMDGDLGSNVMTLTEKLIGKAKLDNSAKRRERMLNFAMVLNDAMLNAREAQISAESARHMAEKAELSYQKTKRGVDMLQRLATSLVKSTAHS